VLEVLDRLVDTRLQVSAEVTIPIAHALVSRAASLAEVRQVHSHPQAAGQVRKWLADHLPGLPVQAATSTGRAAEMAKDDPAIAAVAPRVAAEVFDLNVLADNILDFGGNVTRFLVLSRSTTAPPTGNDRTALVFSVRDRVGALRDLTDAFASAGVNLSSIQSRPSKRKVWDYLFFVELAGHASEPHVQEAIRRAEQHTVFLKVIGSWPIADEPSA
jgi:chorismate mutase/prephenate dehydratase